MNKKFILIYSSIALFILSLFYFNFNFNRYEMFTTGSPYGVYRFDKRTGRVELIIFGNDKTRIFQNLPNELPRVDDLLEKEGK